MLGITVFSLHSVEIESSPVRCLAADVKSTACGAEFTVWLSSVDGASILYGLLETVSGNFFFWGKTT